jgi:HK97 family phage prohead protease
MTRKREFRKFKSEVRTQNVDGKEKIVGYGAVFNQLSEPMRVGNRTFRERVMPGAFDDCLRSGADIRGLINHDPNLILGRTVAGTMSVASDNHGLRYEIDPPGTSYSDDLMKSMRRGDIDQSSFGFYTVADNWINTDDGLVRELVKAECFDVSPVTYPAYEGSSSGVEMRDLFPDGVPESVENAEPPKEEKKEIRVKVGDKDYSLAEYKAARRAMDPDGDGDDDEPLIDAMFEVCMGCDLVCSASYAALNAFFAGAQDYANPAFQSFIDQAKALIEDLNEAIVEASGELSETPQLDERKRRYQQLFVVKK